MVVRVILISAGLLLAYSPSGAQTRATSADLVGTVRDATEAVLPGATVEATNTATNQTRSTTTGPDGRFVIPALPPGTYDVAVTVSGFAGERR